MSEMRFAGIVPGMDEPKSIELEPGEFRRDFNGPLAPRKVLWSGLVWSAVALAGGWWAAWHVGTWWGALLPIPGAFWLGIASVGLFPRFWYGKPD